MKIGFFTDSYLPNLDGVATSVETCVNELEKMGHEVYVIAPKYPHTKDKKNVIRIFSLKVTTQVDVRLALQVPQTSLIKILRRDFDIIHGHSGGPVSFLGWQIAKLYGVPYIATYHTFWNKYSHYFLKGVIRPKMLELSSTLFGNVCDTLIAPTEKVKDELRAYGIRKPIYVIPSGLETERFENVKKGYLKKKYKVPSNATVLLTVSRLGTEKSVDFLIKSFKYIHTNEPNSYLFIVGNGPEKTNLKNLSEKLGISDHVIFTGPVKHADIAKTYADADIFLFASKTETQGMVVLEAMASGVPVVVVLDKVFKDVVIHNTNGFLLKKNITTFGEHVVNLIRDKELQKKFSTNAKKTSEMYSIHKMTKSLIALYEHVLSTTDIDKTTWRESIRVLKSDFKHLVKPYSTPIAKVYLNVKELNKLKNYIMRNILQ